MVMPFLRERVDRGYATISENLLRDNIDGHAMRPELWTYGVLDASNNCLYFLFCARVWQNAVRYEMKRRVGEDDIFFVLSHNREFLYGSVWRCSEALRMDAWMLKEVWVLPHSAGSYDSAVC